MFYMKSKNLLLNEEFVEALSDLSIKISEEFGVQVPSNYFEKVIKAHTAVIRKIEESEDSSLHSTSKL